MAGRLLWSRSLRLGPLGIGHGRHGGSLQRQRRQERVGDQW